MKYCLIILFITLNLVLSCKPKVSIKGHHSFYHDETSDTLTINTYEGSSGWVHTRRQLVRIMENTSLTIKDQSADLIKGSLYFLKNMKDDLIDKKYFFENKEGRCQLMRLAVNDDRTDDYFSKALLTYQLDKEVKTLETEAVYLFSKSKRSYYGFFIPYTPVWKIKSVKVDLTVYKKDQLYHRFIDEYSLTTTEWIHQKLYFNETKSSSLVNVDKSKVQREREERIKIWGTLNTPRIFDAGFSVPLETPDLISSEYGLIRDWILSNGKLHSRDTHLGVDYARKKGIPVFAAADGIIRHAKECEYYGNLVIIEHGIGMYSEYAHMSQIDVQVGEKVTKGQKIGTVGATGAATGPHLHWSSRVLSVPVDPRSFLNLHEVFIE